MSAPQSDFVFHIHDVSRRYSGDTIHFPDEIRIPRGEMIGVLGRSGSGKTTLLNLLAVMDQADAGTITFHPAKGESQTYDAIYRSAEAAAKFRQEKFGFVFQNDELLDGFSVRDNIQMPYWPSGKQLASSSLSELIASLKLHEIQGIVDRNPADLSAGQRSRIGLLRAFSGSPGPEVIFADEPTANVDFHLETEIYRLLQRWRSDPEYPERTILLSTHRLDIASQYCTSYIIIQKDASGNSKGILLPGKRTESELRELVVGNHQSGPSETASLPVNSETQSHSRFRALWKFLFYDFWRYPRAENNFLVTRLAPILVVVALFLFIWLGSFILGIREGSGKQYAEQIGNDLLWNTQMDADESQVQQLLVRSKAEGGKPLFKSYNGFHRTLVSIYRASATEYGDSNFEELTGRTMEDADPLLDRIGETMVWPSRPEDRAQALQRFRDADFGIVVSRDSLVQTLGYTEGSWPEQLPVRFDAFVKVWMPVIGVAREIPGADFVMHPGIYGCYVNLECMKSGLETTRFFLKPTVEIQAEDSALPPVRKWLSGMGVEPDDVQLRTIRGEQLIRVDLADPRSEFDLLPLLKKNLGQIHDVASGVRFPKEIQGEGTGIPYGHWSVILERDMDTIRRLIQQSYKNNIIIDTSVQARVAALQGSFRIFQTLSMMLFVTALVLASMLLFTTIWFDSNRKIHSVGVMLGLGISRPLLISAYALQFYLLIGVLLVSYVVAELAGLPKWLAGGLGRLAFGSSNEGLLYAGWSGAWFAYIGVVLLLAPAIIAALRSLIYKRQPAELLNFRD